MSLLHIMKRNRNDHRAPLLSQAAHALRLAVDARVFNRNRQVYYDYLSALLQGTEGGLTLKQIFAADARRHGTRSARGRLSRRWLHLFQAAGGDLAATWAGVFPEAELALLRNAQARGNETLNATFSELAHVLAVLEAGRRILQVTLLAAVVAFTTLLVTVMAVPALTVPRLRDTFAAIPPEYHGQAMRGLVDFAEVLGRGWPLIVPLLMGLFALALMSFRRYTGPLRAGLDTFGPWRVYRQIQTLRFLALLAVALGRGEHGVTRLRDALQLQLAGASPWLGFHLRTMLENIESGRTGAVLFDTGLLESEHLWFLDDMLVARGLAEGLRRTASWVERQLLDTVTRQAATLRWCLLLSAVAGVLSIALWHYAALDELRRGLALFHASQ